MTRADLVSLTPDALAALANRGLVKRAAKDLDAGNGPEITVSPDGTVEGTYPDGAATSLPAGAGLDAATCSCAATGTCRHQICLVLAYQRHAAGEPAPEPAADWSPGAFDDDALVRVLGQRAVTAARRTFRAGYSAVVRRPTGGDPVAEVELPTCTVRFLVPGEPGYVHTDAVAVLRGEVTMLAVWAFRAADERGLTGDEVRLDVGGAPGRATGGDGLDTALELADQVLLDGAAHAGPVLVAALGRAAADLAARGAHWPAAALDDLAGQLTAHHDRRADHDPRRVAELLAEVHARHRASRATPEGGDGRLSQVLGTDEAAETPLRRVRLAGLGCRVAGTDDTRTADVYFAHTGTGIVLVLKRRWDVPDGTRTTGADLAGRRILGASLRRLAAANVVSETATRTAGRVVRVAAGRVARTTVTPLGDAWEALPARLLVRDYAAEGRALDALPPRLVRPRVEAEPVRVVEIAEVRDLGYRPGAQRLEARVADKAGATAVVSADYSPHRPAALDALAAALSAGPRLVAGAVRRDRGGLVIDPFAVLTPDGVVVPDLEPGDGTAALDGPAWDDPDPLGHVLDEALDACADAAHRGFSHLTPGLRDRIARAGRDLERAGLRTTAGTLAAFAAALTGDDPRRAARAWATACVRLITTAELR
ncbi:hypothetical protein BZB76_6286 [Actinomadura pelletieri DSM 43383]|uniref:SWIM-type domain-containing protein n=1 Tax=Actinomadura pelletieri DSM 43383 TaxID=1120940 RepID=A0A495QC26_9ACTN|nr:hypothetical protein [Actinomadura pelletieri]RKS69147.1 hypothetical protein BZB76_6286 [Actinomadura pelletieri DSM 43383]